ncbi:MAG: hypothetical protein WKG01_03035 [Kofleriaceae bacterium]
MRPTEAAWIANQLAALPIATISPFLNIGSSTAEFRERKQPHIDREIFAPLRAKGVEIIHADLKDAPGVDVAGDLADPQIQARLRERQPRAALSSNLLEHVRDPGQFARLMRSLVAPGGFVIVTVPRSYPFHADPIDTGFRPSPEELAALFPGTRLVVGEVVADSTYGAELWQRGPRRAVRSLLGALKPFGDAAKNRRDSLRWLVRPFTTSCVVLAT